MKAVIDDKIPYIKGQVERIANEVVYLPGQDFTPEAVSDADFLIIRTRTRCDKQLLGNSQVRFIATATIGYDHIDTDFCQKAGITWTNCPGCNANSVTQYVQSALIRMAQKNATDLSNLTIGIVGVGNVGSRVAEMVRQRGMTVLLNDPPRAEAEESDAFVPISEVMGQADIITFHVPLVKEGKHPTFHLADQHFFDHLQRRPWLLNTSRGEVVETDALKQAIRQGQVTDTAIDVWEHEPNIDRTLLQSVFIGTPHIAGYSADGKANATRLSLENVCRHFKLNISFDIHPPLPPQTHIEAKDMDEALLRIYDPMADCERLRRSPEQFEALRGNYPLRREPSAYDIHIK